MSLRQTAAWASMLGIAELSNPGVKYRLNQATGFLATLVDHLLAATILGAELRWPGRIHGVFDLGRGGFSHLERTDQQGAEALDRGRAQPGEFRIGDRNFARATPLRRFRADSGDAADFIARLGWSALRLTTPAGRPFDLIGYLQCLPPDTSPHEENWRTPLGDGEPALALRLIVQRKPPQAAEATREALRRAAARTGKAVDPRSLIAAKFMLLATSLPRNGYSAKAILAVHRLRWQIEMAFKRL